MTRASLLSILQKKYNMRSFPVTKAHVSGSTCRHPSPPHTHTFTKKKKHFPFRLASPNRVPSAIAVFAILYGSECLGPKIGLPGASKLHDECEFGFGQKCWVRIVRCKTRPVFLVSNPQLAIPTSYVNCGCRFGVDVKF